jgi:ElaB/YqjD/DUF883 family membrane-anchored ribosome-binding protein
MSIEGDEEAKAGRAPGSAALAAAAKHAQQAVEAAKGVVSETSLDDVSTKAAAAASLYEDGRQLLSNHEELAQAAESLSAAIRKNPLAAVGVAFTAGLLLALLTRG